MKFFSSYSLRTTTIIVGASLIAVNIAATLFYFIPSFNDNIRMQGMQEAGNLLGAFQGTIENHLRLNDLNSIQREFAAQSSNPKNKAIILLNEDNQVTASTRLSWIGRDILETGLDINKAYIGESYLHGRILYNVSQDGRHIYGYAPVQDTSTSPDLRAARPAIIVLQYDLSFEQAEHTKSYFKLITFTSLLTALTIFLYWLIIHRLVTTRARHIIETTDAFSHGSPEARCQVEGADELAQIANSINAMAEKIIDSQRVLAESKERLQLALQGANEGFWDLDMTTGSAYFSSRFEEMLGYAPGTIRPHIRGWVSLTHPDDRDKIKSAFREYSSNLTGKFSIQYRIKTKWGAYRWVHTRGKIVKSDGAGNPLRAAGTQRDISDLKAAEEIMERQSLALNQLSDGVMITNLDGAIIEWNEGAKNLFGYQRGEVEGKTLGSIVNIRSARELDGIQIFDERSPRDARQGGHLMIMPIVLAKIKNNDQWTGEIEVISRSGDPLTCEITFVPFVNTESQIVAAIGVCRDISDRKANERQIRHMATHDPLTQLPNRTLIMDRLIVEMNRTKRTHVELAIMFVDLDHFKEVNDSFGHEAGDQLLFQVAERLRSVVRDVDTVGRLGGDEFLIILTEIQGRPQVEEIASRIIEFVAMPFYIKDNKVNIYASIGIRLYSGGSESADELISDADNTMYEVKKGGKNNFKIMAQP